MKNTAMSVAQFQPMPGYVLVEPAQMQKKTASGIYLPDTHDEKPQYGTVIAIGGAIYQDGKEVVPTYRVGVQVIYKKWGGNEFKLGDVEYQFLKFEDILAVISK